MLNQNNHNKKSFLFSRKMDIYSNKEKSKLLQKSESLSNSDLELPEVILQKRRKKRRKTIQKSPCRPKTEKLKFCSYTETICVILVICWLSTLSYLILNFHAESVRLSGDLRKGLQINVPLRLGGKKIRKRRELDALIANSIAKRGQIKTQNPANGNNSQDKLLSASTDEQEEYVWPTVVRNPSRSRKKNYTFLHMCGPLLILCFAILLVLMYWLHFDLRQQLYDYRQKVEEVSATSQNLPDTLQKWHETSAYLAKNQSIIFAKINELCINMEELNSNLTAYKANLKSKQDFIEDQKVVANFGAKIEAVATDVEEIKEHFINLVNNQKNIKNEMERLQFNFTEMVNIASRAGSIPSNFSNELESLKTSFSNDIKMGALNLSIINDTLSQKSGILKDELRNHKIKIDELLDRSANMTSHVTSIEDSWTKYRQKILDIGLLTSRIEDNLWEVKNNSAAIEQAVRNISLTCTNCNNEYQNDNKHQNKSIPYELDRNSRNDGNWSLSPGSKNNERNLPSKQESNRET